MRTLALALVSLAMLSGCGAPGDSPVVGTWRGATSTPEIVNTLDYRDDGTFTLTGTITAALTSTMPGCVTRSITRGGYTVSGDELTQFGAVGYVEVTGCNDPAQNRPQSPRAASQVESYNITYRFALDGDALRLTTPRGTTLAWSRAR